MKTLKDFKSKDRVYVLNGKKPLTSKIRTKGIIWFDEEKGYNREIRYSVNQKSLFVDEQDGLARLGHVIFENGNLFVPRTQPLLQQLMSIYHPGAETRWKEIDDEAKANDEVDETILMLEAMNLVNDLEPEHLEAIMRTELGSSVTKMSTKELKRDAFNFAKEEPKLFVELSKDEDIKLRNIANIAVERGIIKLTDDNTVFKFPNGKKIISVPFEEHPYGALSKYFKTDEGSDLLKSISKKL